MDSPGQPVGLGLLPHVSDLRDADRLDVAALQAASRELRTGRLARLVITAGTLAAPLFFAPWGEETFARPKLIALVVATVAGLLAASSSADRWKSSVVDIPLAAFLALVIAATLASPDQGRSISGQFPEYQGLMAATTYVGVFVVVRLAFRGKAILRWMHAVAAAGGAVGAYALVQAAGWDPLWSNLEGGRTFATIGLPNSLAAYLVVSAAITAAVARASQRPTGWWALVAVQGAALATTLSRGGYLGAAVVALVFLMLNRRNRPARPLGRAWTAFALITVAAAALLIPGARSTVGEASSRIAEGFSGENTSVQQHLALWDVAWTATLRDPLLGTGPDLFPFAYAAVAGDALDAEQQALFADVRPESPHNVPLALASGSGLPSVLAYLVFVTLVVAVGIKTVRRSGGIKAILLAGLIAAAAGHIATDMFMTAELSSSWTFWAVLGAIVAISVVDPERAPAGTLPGWPGTTSLLWEEASEVPSAHDDSKRF